MQLTPPGSGCSIAIGKGLMDSEPGSIKGLQLVVTDIEAARAELAERGMDVSEVDRQPWGAFVYFQRPGRQRLGGSGHQRGHRRGSSPVKEKPAFTGGRRSVGSRNGGESENDRLSLDRRGESPVVVGKPRGGALGEFGADHRAQIALLREPRGRHAIGFRKHHVEGDRSGTKTGKTVDEPCKIIARPWPLPDLRERHFIDVDHANGH